MATKMRIYSSLVLTAAALFVVPLSSDEAAARGGLGGGGGMRSSFGVVRTSPVVISRSRTTSVSTLRKQTVSQTKLKNFQAGDKLKNKQVVEKLKNAKLKNKQEDKLNTKLTERPPIQCNAKVSAHGCGGGGGGGSADPGKGDPSKGDPSKGDPSKGDPSKGDPSKGDPSKGDPSKGDPSKGDPSKDHGGIIEKEKPPVIIVERPRPIYVPGVSVGVAPAAVAVDPPGCVYERSVRKLPGGGLQRVIVKICPDA
jgi:hypothetical protein